MAIYTHNLKKPAAKLINHTHYTKGRGKQDPKTNCVRSPSYYACKPFTLLQMTPSNDPFPFACFTEQPFWCGAIAEVPLLIFPTPLFRRGSNCPHDAAISPVLSKDDLSRHSKDHLRPITNHCQFLNKQKFILTL